MSNRNVVSLRPYQKACTKCSKQILMSPEGGHWKALEADTKESHRCMMQTQNTSQVKENTPTKTHQYSQDEIDVTLDVLANRIQSFEKRLASIESWIKKVSQEWTMNHQ